MNKLRDTKNGMYGKHHSLETRQKWSKERKGRTYDELHGSEKAKLIKQKISKTTKGRTYEEIYGIEQAKYQKMLRSKGRKGKKHTEETKQKMKGKVVSLETRKKLSLANKGKPRLHKHKQETCMCRTCLLKRGIVWNKGLTKETSEKVRKAAEKRKGQTWDIIYGPKKAKIIKEKQSKRVSGSNNPSWRGGISKLPYSYEFNEKLKNQIRERDNYCCQICKESENGVGHSVHHIDYDKDNSNKLNLITLCKVCHNRTSFNRMMWKIVLQEYQNIRFSDNYFSILA